MLRIYTVVAGLLVALASLPASGTAQLWDPSSVTAQEIEGVATNWDLARPVHFDELRTLRAFFERVDVSGVAKDLAPPMVDKEYSIAGAAARLPPEWEAPFLFVQGAIGYVPYAGSVRGARGTLESGSGNAIDQALLLAALLEARGGETRLVRGRLKWSQTARLMMGTSTPKAPEAGDPWPRWLEGAADHWWVQARHNGEWVDLDPSFVDTVAGEYLVAPSEWHGQLPSELETSVRLELRHGDLIVTEVNLSAARVVGETVLLGFTPRSRDAVKLWELSETLVTRQLQELKHIGLRLGLLPQPPRTPDASNRLTVPGPIEVVSRPLGPFLVSEPVSDEPSTPPRSNRPAAFQRIFLDPESGPWISRFEIPGQVLEAGPFEEAGLDSLSIRITVSAPLVPAQVMEVPWGGGSEGSLALVIGAGRVSDGRLAAGGKLLYAELNRLAGLEQTARSSMLPPISYFDAVETLDAAARSGWDAFKQQVPGALAWALLHSMDRVSEQSPAARVVRQGLRLAAVRWRPPGDTYPGSLEVIVNDPVTIGQLSGLASAPALRAANGLVQSAVLSQMLNRLVERAPETAFDVTLRAIGMGRGLAVFAAENELPTTWPAAVRAEATLGLRAGYRVMAPRRFTDDHSGWWHVGVVDGEMVGWVPGVQKALQGRVKVGSVGRLINLERLLASLASLHRATRWLIDLSGRGPMALASVPSAACGSAAVAADVLATTLTSPFPYPDVLSLCGPR